tara:strand:- start:50 stop:418 length:369 start_codon:yes stop_codon:yes gene_type:complete
METVMPTDWSNLSALGCLIGLVLWFVVKGLPGLLERQARDSAAARADFKESIGSVVNECSQQRQEFREESALQRAAAKDEANTMRHSFEHLMAQQREQSALIAKSGHASLDNLAHQIEAIRE